MVLLVIVLIVVLATSSSNNPPSTKTAADVKTTPIPASLQMVAVPPTTPGPEGIPIPKGAKLATLAPRRRDNRWTGSSATPASRPSPTSTPI